MLVGLALLGTTASSQGPGAVRASATIAGCTDSSMVGQAILNERPSDEGIKVVEVSVVMQGLTTGAHGVHIHEVGACTPCSAAGGHFDPGPNSNSSPDGNHPFHSGDLVNVEVNANGAASMHTTTSRITLSPGVLSVFDANGSAIVIHANPDTYCPDGALPGCAGGARVACGILQLE
jgi:Cu-Zn family superoxide dismutase